MRLSLQRMPCRRVIVSNVLALAVVACCAFTALAIDDSIPAIHGDVSRNLLGDGTGVIIGMVDSGVDDLHPALTGLDSLGNPRMVAEANFVPTEPGSTGDDVFGHGTWTSSVALSSDATRTGMAPDARFVNARVLANNGGFDTGSWIQNGIGFAVEQGADVLNVSLNFFSTNSSGNSSLDRMLDWAAYEEGISVAVASGNISQASQQNPLVRSPGSAYNGVTVGRTTSNYSRVHSDSAIAPTADGRGKPDVVAPGTLLTLANDDWEGAANDWDSNLGGTSFATPHVAGLMAQQLEYGNTNGFSTNPLVIKTTIMNSTLPILNKSSQAWSPAASSTTGGGVFEATSPLDLHGGAGQIDGGRLYDQYAAGEQDPGTVQNIGWDIETVTGTGIKIYDIGQNLAAGTELTATLSWFRHITRIDNGNGIIDSLDNYVQIESIENLDLEILLDGIMVARSHSSVDNVEFLRYTVPTTGDYSIRVRRNNVAGTGLDELYGLAWHSIAAALDGDFNSDGSVDGTDFLLWQNGFGIMGGATLGDGDANGDGNVDGSDFLVWQNNFGTSGGDGALAARAVPEPSSVCLLLFAGLGFIVTLRKRIAG